MENENKNKEEQNLFTCRLPMKYELMTDPGLDGVKVSTLMRDLGVSEISFYSFEMIKLHSLVKVTFKIGEHDALSFVVKVSSIEKCTDETLGYYLIGATIERIDPTVEDRLHGLLETFDITKILDSLDLRGVFDIHFIAGYPPMVKRFSNVVPINDKVLSKEAVQGVLLSLLDDSQYISFLKEREMNFVFPYKHIRYRANDHF